MADLRELFPILENQSTKAGVPWSAVAPGDAAAGLGAGPVLPCKDEAGDLQYIPMYDGKVVVSSEAADIAHLFDQGTHAGDKDNYQDLATITLTNDKVYQDLSWVASCYRDAHFEIVQIDDSEGIPVETVLADILTSAGDVTDSGKLEDVQFTAGSTGVCLLVIRAKNFESASTLRASISIKENQ